MVQETSRLAMPVTVNPSKTTSMSKAKTTRATSSHAPRKATNMTRGEKPPTMLLVDHMAMKQEKGICQSRISKAMFIVLVFFEREG